MFARLENNIVMEILDVETLPNFHPDLIWVACGGGVAQGFIHDNGVFTDPETLITADDVRPQKLRKISSMYHSKIEEGFLYADDLYHLDATARTNMGLMKLEIDAGGVNPHGGYWVGMDGVHALTDVAVVAMADAARLAYRGLLFAKATHEATLNATTDKAAILSYDVDAGWP